MSEPRQKPIPVTRQERASLEQHRRRYEDTTGDRGDWGKFLGTIVLLGLAAAGIYSLAKASEKSAQTGNIQCPVCKRDFLMAVPTGTGRVIYTKCPLCKAELVVDLGE